ncbi:hypothetical protein HYPBUDRAFT_108448 [Hyphopichia burtonii NRRL Y-1933]|uniref:PH-domain-containing protein n=1 Tax=Hyphopichia burtonii NRRL Y-1933 TaxID=984485 RepID=A0A1E4RK31_9ASCO|nr:hypothetical protein HYPBUDRAFT_108448 [Hyphopichia burtonii NRRL Y-1933]ODV67638.1 hypothetical protein HYPBUDRAFT_108448 [Hyphopichia burtonii NRRL Y-1933]
MTEGLNGASLYICIKQFNARLGDELDLKVGDKVEVLADDSEYNDGWYMGKNLITEQVGLYPKSFTQVLANSEPSTGLLRSRSRRVNSEKNLNSKLNTATSKPQESNKSPLSPKINQLAENFEKLSTSNSSVNKRTSSGQVHKTMDDIDKALEEMQTDSLSPNQSKSTPINLSHQRNPSAQSLTEDLNPLHANDWTPQQVSSYFAIVLGFDLDVAGKFSRHKITGEILFQLDLTHLKELDIDSFGTRFEVYKEIENLKQISSRLKKFNKPVDELSEISEDDPSNVNDSKNFNNSSNSPYNNTFNNVSFPHNNSDDDQLSRLALRSQLQLQLLPSVSIDTATPKPLRTNSSIRRHQRKRSQSMENIPLASGLSTPKQSNELTFMSPRKAPEPPAQSPLNRSFKFGDGNKDSHDSPSSSSNALYMTRTNASNAGLGISNVNNGGLSRPASSVYETSVISDATSQNKSRNINRDSHRRNSSVISSNNHRRHSSLFSFLSGNNDDKDKEVQQSKYQSQNIHHDDDLKSPAKVKRQSKFIPKQPNDLTGFGDPDDSDAEPEYVDIDNTQFSPRKSKSVRGEISNNKRDSSKNLKDEKRSASDSTALTNNNNNTAAPNSNAPVATRLKNLRTASTQNFRNLTGLKKLKTSAFQEGIREVSPDDAIKSANFSGWMSKKSGSTLGWRSRYFTLHGTRLSYFASLKDKKEKGLIDITAHKVIPVNTESEAITSSNDKYVALYAASTGFGRYCFKLVPPAPGFKKGLTFTQPKTHFFAVESYEEMRGWIKALMTATIDIDDSVPVVSSCSTPTVSLLKAQELLAKAREETKLKDEELRAKGFIRDGFDDDYSGVIDSSGNYNNFFGNSTVDNQNTSNENSPIVDSLDETTMSSVQRQSTDKQPKLSIDTSVKGYKSPSTPQVSNGQNNSNNNGASHSGFASPYLLASGLLSPKLGHSFPPSSPIGTPNSRERKQPDYFNQAETARTDSKLIFSSSNGRVVSGSKKKDKMLAYSSDGSGNHTFVIKSKK